MYDYTPCFLCKKHKYMVTVLWAEKIVGILSTEKMIKWCKAVLHGCQKFVKGFSQ